MTSPFCVLGVMSSQDGCLWKMNVNSEECQVGEMSPGSEEARSLFGFWR